MYGGTTEIHLDSEPLATGTHKWGTSDNLNDPGADFRSCGVRPGLYIENATRGIYGHVATVTEDQVTVAWVSESGGGDITFGGSSLTFGSDEIYFNETGAGSLIWATGDVYNIYKTTTKDSLISSQWCDLSRGWMTDKRLLREGWRAEDRDMDRDRPGRVFGPGQPGRS